MGTSRMIHAGIRISKLHFTNTIQRNFNRTIKSLDALKFLTAGILRRTFKFSQISNLDRLPNVTINVSNGLLLSSILLYNFPNITIDKSESYINDPYEDPDVISNIYYKILLKKYEDEILDSEHEMHKRVEKIVLRLKNYNDDINMFNEKRWSIQIIDKDLIDIFIIPSGDLFVSKGMVETCSNDDALAFIIGHEMAHIALDHHNLRNRYRNINYNWLEELKNARDMELEADIYGMELAAKACFDAREAPSYWKKIDMAMKDEKLGYPFSFVKAGTDIPEFLSTHPTPMHRFRNLKEHLPKAIAKGTSCGCPSLIHQEPDPKLQYQEYMKRRNGLKPDFSNM